MHEPWDENALRECSPLILAYIGDAVFELMVRTHIVEIGQRKIKDIHLDTVAMVKADSQAHIIRQIIDELSEAEQDIVRRGRNTHSHPPKNADIQAYRMSTGFEALLGYLYLKGDEERLSYLLKRILEEQ
ncbi:MAG TPA: ribonuclease III domain-containing protein [Syntrophomonas sp.]|jgi:ribonuclease-3 family protein|nr:ribonuclease III domain-containing protein [Syntrophomonas sp.]